MLQEEPRRVQGLEGQVTAIPVSPGERAPFAWALPGCSATGRPPGKRSAAGEPVPSTFLSASAPALYTQGPAEREPLEVWMVVALLGAHPGDSASVVVFCICLLHGIVKRVI